MRDMVTIQLLTALSTQKKRFVTKLSTVKGEACIIPAENLFKQAEGTMISDLTRSVTRFGKEKNG